MTIRNALIVLTLALVAISASGCSAEDSNVNEELIKQSNALLEIDRLWRCTTHNYSKVSPILRRSEGRWIGKLLRPIRQDLAMTDASEMNHIKDTLELMFDVEYQMIQDEVWDRDIPQSRINFYGIWNDLLDENAPLRKNTGRYLLFENVPTGEYLEVKWSPTTCGYSKK